MLRYRLNWCTDEMRVRDITVECNYLLLVFRSVLWMCGLQAYVYIWERVSRFPGSSGGRAPVANLLSSGWVGDAASPPAVPGSLFYRTCRAVVTSQWAVWVLVLGTLQWSLPVKSFVFSFYNSISSIWCTFWLLALCMAPIKEFLFLECLLVSVFGSSTYVP